MTARKALQTDDGLVEITGKDFTAHGIDHPARVMYAWAAEELMAIGVYDLVSADEPPFGFRRQGEPVLQLEDGVAVETFELVEIPLEDLKSIRMEDARTRRWTAETGGMVFAGQRIASDEKGQAKAAGLVQLFEKDPGLETVDWEAQPGVWISIARPAADALGVAMGRHVQTCFSRCRQLHEAIQAAVDAEALASIDLDDGWPPNTLETETEQ